MTTSQAIQDHYEHHPCPTVAELQFRDPIDHMRGTLNDPDEGLAKISEVLAPGGAARLTVYSRAHRGALQSFRSVLDVLAPPDRPKQAAPRDQWRAVYHLAGFGGPMLEVLAEPAGQPERPPYSDAELLAMKPLWMQQMVGYRVEHGRITAHGSGPSYQQQGDMIAGRGLGTGGIQFNWQLPRYTESIFSACDGKTTVSELQQRFDEDFAPEDVLALVQQFLPDQLGLLVPMMG